MITRQLIMDGLFIYTCQILFRSSCVTVAVSEYNIIHHPRLNPVQCQVAIQYSITNLGSFQRQQRCLVWLTKKKKIRSKRLLWVNVVETTEPKL